MRATHQNARTPKPRDPDARASRRLGTVGNLARLNVASVIGTGDRLRRIAMLRHPDIARAQRPNTVQIIRLAPLVDAYQTVRTTRTASSTQHCIAMNQPGTKTERPGQDRRNFRRFVQGSLSSSIGPVLDLSTSGMRVIAKKPWCGEIPVRISARGIDISVRATVMWSRKLGFRAYELGLIFNDLDDVSDLTSWLAEWNT